MEENFFTHISDPLNSKLLIEIYERKQVTTADLLKKFSDISQATLYRHLKKMLNDDVIKVVEENPIRGTVEKVYALNYDINASWKNMRDSNDSQKLMQYINYSLLGILKEFQEYTAKEDIDIKGDGTGIIIAPIYATFEELNCARNKFFEILNELESNKPQGERKLYNICTVITPPKDYKEREEFNNNGC